MSYMIHGMFLYMHGSLYLYVILIERILNNVKDAVAADI